MPHSTSTHFSHHKSIRWGIQIMKSSSRNLALPIWYYCTQTAGHSLARNSLLGTITINHQVSSTILWQSADHLCVPALVVNSSILFLSLFVRQFVSGTSARGGSKVERSAGLKGMRDGIMTSRRGRETWQLCSREKLFPWFARPRLDCSPAQRNQCESLPVSVWVY